MSALALSLVLAAALLHASWNLVAKKAGGGNHFVPPGAVFVSVLWAPAALWIGVEAIGRPGWLEWSVLVASAVIHVLYFRTLLHGYSVSDPTVVYPVAGQRAVADLARRSAAARRAADHCSARRRRGGGRRVFLIAGGPALWRQAHDPARRLRVRRGIAWGALTGASLRRTASSTRTRSRCWRSRRSSSTTSATRCACR